MCYQCENRMKTENIVKQETSVDIGAIMKQVKDNRDYEWVEAMGNLEIGFDKKFEIYDKLGIIK